MIMSFCLQHKLNVSLLLAAPVCSHILPAKLCFRNSRQRELHRLQSRPCLCHCNNVDHKGDCMQVVTKRPEQESLKMPEDISENAWLIWAGFPPAI